MMPPIPWNPDRARLVEFSEAALFFLGMVASPLAYFRGRPTLAAAFWVAAVFLRLLGLVSPRRLRPIYLALTLAAWPIGWVVSRLVLALIYYGVVTPIGLALRLLGRDPLARRPDPSAASYWERYDPDRGPGSYLRQF